MMYANNTTQEDSTKDSIIAADNEPLVSLSIEGLRVVQIVNHVVLSGTVCLFGIIVNIINMIIFAKQGLKDTVNMSLFAISISDLCSLITLEWLNMNLNPFMEDADVPFEPVDIQYFTGGWPHACFARITIWITIYVTAERFCCIAFPTSVKRIITPLRTKIVICVIYLLMFLSLAPVYVPMYFGEKFYPARNQTRIGLVDRGFKLNIDSSVFLLYAVIGFVSFSVLILFTTLLVVSLKRRTNWKKRTTLNQDQTGAISRRDKKTVTLVSLISIILIVCFTPAVILNLTVFTVPGFDLTGIYANIFHTAFSIVFLSEAINSSVNIFLFYKMNSRYRRTFDEMFSKCRTCKSRDGSNRTASLVLPEAASDSIAEVDVTSGNSSLTNVSLGQPQQLANSPQHDQPQQLANSPQLEQHLQVVPTTEFSQFDKSSPTGEVGHVEESSPTGEIGQGLH